jgi:hypothetical protein
MIGSDNFMLVSAMLSSGGGFSQQHSRILTLAGHGCYTIPRDALVRKAPAEAQRTRRAEAKRRRDGQSQLTQSALRSLLEDVGKRRRTFFQFAMHSLRGIA